jgi:NADP-dependent 3-hydroxy acid dehydrogenase YdfG
MFVASHPTPAATIGAVPTLLVFGARNLGRAIARHMAGLGWSVSAVAQSLETLERLKVEVDGALTIQADAGTSVDVERAFAETRMRFATVDLVVVAISPSTRGRGFGGGAIAESDQVSFAPYFDDLLPALTNVLRVGARTLQEQGSGTFIQITGGSARRGMPERGPWAAAAFATRGLIQSAASELREHGVHVALLIVDATIESEKTAAFLEGRPKESTASEEDVAAAVAYLAAQTPRAWTHELQLTPSGDRWVP